jgi:hypothetical protein
MLTYTSRALNGCVAPLDDPAIICPSHEIMFPINVAHIRHEWAPSTNTPSGFGSRARTRR